MELESVEPVLTVLTVILGVLAGGLAASKYVQILFATSKTYPRVCSVLIVLFSWLYCGNLINLAFSVQTDSFMHHLYRASLAFGATYLLYAPLQLFVPTKTLVMDKDTLMEALKGNVSNGKTCTMRRVFGFIGFFFYAAAMIVSVLGLYVLLQDVQKVDALTLILVAFAYAAVAIFWMVVTACMLTGIPCNIGGIDLISELRRNVGRKVGGVRQEWLKSAGYKKLYLFTSILFAIGFIVFLIFMIIHDTAEALNDFGAGFGVIFYWAADIICFITLFVYAIYRCIRPAPIASEVKIAGKNISLDRVKSIGLARRTDRSVLLYSSIEEPPKAKDIQADMELCFMHQPNSPNYTWKSSPGSFSWGTMYQANDSALMMCFATGKSYAPFLLNLLAEAISTHVGSIYYPESRPFTAQDGSADQPALSLVRTPCPELDLVAPLQWNSGHLHEFMDNVCVRFSDSKSLVGLKGDIDAREQAAKARGIFDTERNVRLAALTAIVGTETTARQASLGTSRKRLALPVVRMPEIDLSLPELQMPKVRFDPELSLAFSLTGIGLGMSMPGIRAPKLKLGDWFGSFLEKIHLPGLAASLGIGALGGLGLSLGSMSAPSAPQVKGPEKTLPSSDETKELFKPEPGFDSMIDLFVPPLDFAECAKTDVPLEIPVPSQLDFANAKLCALEDAVSHSGSAKRLSTTIGGSAWPETGLVWKDGITFEWTGVKKSSSFLDTLTGSDSEETAESEAEEDQNLLDLSALPSVQTNKRPPKVHGVVVPKKKSYVFAVSEAPLYTPEKKEAMYEVTIVRAVRTGNVSGDEESPKGVHVCAGWAKRPVIACPSVKANPRRSRRKLNGYLSSTGDVRPAKSMWLPCGPRLCVGDTLSCRLVQGDVSLSWEYAVNGQFVGSFVGPKWDQGFAQIAISAPFGTQVFVRYVASGVPAPGYAHKGMMVDTLVVDPATKCPRISVDLPLAYPAAFGETRHVPFYKAPHDSGASNSKLKSMLLGESPADRLWNSYTQVELPLLTLLEHKSSLATTKSVGAPSHSLYKIAYETFKSMKDFGDMATRSEQPLTVEQQRAVASVLNKAWLELRSEMTSAGLQQFTLLKPYQVPEKVRGSMSDFWVAEYLVKIWRWASMASLNDAFVYLVCLAQQAPPALNREGEEILSQTSKFLAAWVSVINKEITIQ